MPGGAVGAGELAVRDIANERMPEGVLDVARERRVAPLADEVETDELPDRGVDCVAADLEGAPPEGRPDHGGVTQSSASLDGEQVDTSGDDRLHRLGQPGAEVRRL